MIIDAKGALAVLRSVATYVDVDSTKAGARRMTLHYAAHFIAQFKWIKYYIFCDLPLAVSI